MNYIGADLLLNEVKVIGPDFNDSTMVLSFKILRSPLIPLKEGDVRSLGFKGDEDASCKAKITCVYRKEIFDMIEVVIDGNIDQFRIMQTLYDNFSNGKWYFWMGAMPVKQPEVKRVYGKISRISGFSGKMDAECRFALDTSISHDTVIHHKNGQSKVKKIFTYKDVILDTEFAPGCALAVKDEVWIEYKM